MCPNGWDYSILITRDLFFSADTSEAKETPMNDEKCVLLTKNGHFLKLSPEGHMGSPVREEKV